MLLSRIPSLPQHLIASYSPFKGQLKSPSFSMKPLFIMLSPGDLASYCHYSLS